MSFAKKRSRAILCSAGIAAVAVVSPLGGVSTASAASTTFFDSGGFESYSNGTIVGQNGFAGTYNLPLSAGGAATGTTDGSGVVESGVSSTGSKAVAVTKVADSNSYYPVHANTTVSPTYQYALINWDMNATQTMDTDNPYGPFFGISFYGDGHRFGAAGVDASTGELENLYGTGNASYLDILPTDATTTLGTFHSYEIAIDYSAQQYSMYVDGTLESTSPFTSAAATTGFSDADMVGLQNDTASNAAGLAYFDNLKVTFSTVVPEPVSLGLVVPAAAGMLMRRRARSTRGLN